MGTDFVTLQLGRGTVDIRVAESGGEWSITNGSISPAYGAVCEAPHLVFRCRGTAPFAVSTVIGDGVTSRVASTGEPERSLRAAEVSWRNRHGVLVTAQSSNPGWIETDARVAWIETVESTPQLSSVAAARVSRLIVLGRQFLDSEARLPGFSTTQESSLRETRTED